MKKDYLWDKTGSDAEIEKLENLLQVYRCGETAPPLIPAKILPFVKKETPRRSFPFIRAVAACLALASISLGVWILFSNTKNEIAGEIIQKSTIDPKFVNSTKMPDERATPAMPKIEHKPIIRKTVFIEPQTPKKSFLTSKTNSKNIRKEKSADRKIEDTGQAVRLTAEEKYAYEQLRLALSITSSKLKIVKETIDGAENQPAILNNEK